MCRRDVRDIRSYKPRRRNFMPTEKTPASTPARKRAPRKSVTAAAKSATTVASFVGPETRTALIAEAAYFRAEKRGFAPGHEAEDWLSAEREVDDRLMRAAAARV
jgi:hypothetical protein